MNVAAPFIRRPVATTLIQLSIVIFGILGYSALPVSDLPAVDFPTISVNASLPGANPETMASAVATPLEKSFSSIAGITSISSSNSQGSTNITLVGILWGGSGDSLFVFSPLRSIKDELGNFAAH